MVIDPILPLSISIAEGRRDYAVFLGSGASKDAGIHTGTEIFNDTIRLCYKLENEVEEVNDDDEVKVWFENSDYKDLNYSKILEALCPTREDRKKFLEKYFKGKKPSEVHYSLAKLIKNGLIKAVVTTNFDRLLETALDEMDISYNIVSSEEEIETSPLREHSPCYILKLHGDYKRINIKNTQKELKNLDDKIEKQFQEILNNFGILIIGYSGSDEGVMNCFERRNNQRHILYWTSRNEVSERVDELIKQQDGRLIKRESAEEFLKEVSRKINIFETHKTGETPEYVMQEIKEHIKNKEDLSIKETLKEQMNVIRENWFKICEKTDKEFQNNNSMSVLLNAFKEFEEYCNNITAIGLILLEYSHELFNEIPKYLQKIYDLIVDINEEHNITNNELIKNIPQGIVYNIYYCLGAFALKENKFNELRILLNIELMSKNPHNMTNQNIWLTDCFYPKIFEENAAEVFKFLNNSYEDKNFLKMFFNSKKDFLIFLCHFSVTLSLYNAKMHIESPESVEGITYPTFSIASRSSNQLITFKLKQPKFRRKLASSFGEREFDFVDNYPIRAEKINEIIHIDHHNHPKTKLPSSLI